MSAAHVIGRAIGATLLVCGAHFLVRALTGKTPLDHAKDWLERGKSPRPLLAPRPSGPVAPTRQRAPSAKASARGKNGGARAAAAAPPPPSDPIDESSWESFPASDPPAHSPKNA